MNKEHNQEQRERISNIIFHDLCCVNHFHLRKRMPPPPKGDNIKRIIIHDLCYVNHFHLRKRMPPPPKGDNIKVSLFMTYVMLTTFI